MQQDDQPLVLALPLPRKGYFVFRFIKEYSSLMDFGLGLFFIIQGFLKDDIFGLC